MPLYVFCVLVKDVSMLLGRNLFPNEDKWQIDSWKFDTDTCINCIHQGPKTEFSTGTQILIPRNIFEMPIYKLISK